MGLARALRLASLSALAAVAQERACGAPEDDATAVGAQLLQRAAEVSRPGPDGTAEPGLLQGGASVEALRAVDDLWSGLDSVPQAAYQDLLQSAANVSATDDDAAGSGGGARPTSLQIAGMFDSGTNLLWALIRANLGERAMGRVCPDEKSGQCFFWKHSPPRQLQRELDALERKGQRVVLVAMVRSPLSQVVSWTKAPYDLGSCIQRATATAGSDSRTRCYVRGEPFTGVTGVWNSYVQEYDRRQGANGDAYHRTDARGRVRAPGAGARGRGAGDRRRAGPPRPLRLPDDRGPGQEPRQAARQGEGAAGPAGGGVAAQAARLPEGGPVFAVQPPEQLGHEGARLPDGAAAGLVPGRLRVTAAARGAARRPARAAPGRR
ncbi:unnamed protein product [Prorocentrum cordatum]|uniref:Uncharacterized protein n=1 Tax=Prorocentrum cordatum TaxID=2364126 RepID=A0ABN9S5V0_9DINO|nr:unnamed protein product [Polarella glacialis]